MTTDILHHLTKKLNILKSERDKEIASLEKFMKKYLFLFHTSIYSDAHDFNYRDETEKWYVNIYYYPSSGTCNISTGTIDHSKQIIGQSMQQDNIPDADKITEAFRRKLVNINKDRENRIGYMKDFRKIFEKVVI